MAYDPRVNDMMEKADSFMDARRYEEALNCIEKCLEYKNDDTDIWGYRATALRYLGRHEEAIESCEVALRYDSENAEAWGAKGGALCDLGRYEEAIKFYEISLRYKQDLAGVWFGKGVALCELGHYEEAISSFETSLRYEPDSAEAWYGKGYALGKLERHEEALKFYEVALKYAPDLFDAAYGKGDTLHVLGLNQKQSVDAASIANELRTTLRKALKEIWEVNDDLGTSDLAIRSQAIFDITQSLLKIGYLPEARTVGEEALKVVPKIREQYELSGLVPLYHAFRTLVVLGKTEDALRLTQEMSRLYKIPLTDEEQSSIVRYISESLAKDVGDFGRATQVAHQIPNPQVKEYALGDICEAVARSGHISKAVELTQEISDSSPDYWRSFYLGEVCRILCEKGQLEEALSICRTINIEKSSSRLSALLSIAEEFAKENRTDEMRVTLKEAMEIPCKDKDWSFSRASEVLAQAGEFEESLETAKRISERHQYHRALGAISGALAARGQIDRALEIAHGLEYEGLESEALCRISEALVETEHVGESKEIALKISDNDKRSDALVHIGKALAREGKALEAFRVVGKIPDEYRYRRNDVLDALMKTLASCGRVDEAIQTSLMYDSISRVMALADIYLAIGHGKSSEGQQTSIGQ